MMDSDILPHYELTEEAKQKREERIQANTIREQKKSAKKPQSVVPERKGPVGVASDSVAARRLAAKRGGIQSVHTYQTSATDITKSPMNHSNSNSNSGVTFAPSSQTMKNLPNTSSKPPTSSATNNLEFDVSFARFDTSNSTNPSSIAIPSFTRSVSYEQRNSEIADLLFDTEDDTEGRPSQLSVASSKSSQPSPARMSSSTVASANPSANLRASNSSLERDQHFTDPFSTASLQSFNSLNESTAASQSTVNPTSSSKSVNWTTTGFDPSFLDAFETVSPKAQSNVTNFASGFAGVRSIKKPPAAGLPMTRSYSNKSLNQERETSNLVDLLDLGITSTTNHSTANSSLKSQTNNPPIDLLSMDFLPDKPAKPAKPAKKSVTYDDLMDPFRGNSNTPTPIYSTGGHSTGVSEHALKVFERSISFGPASTDAGPPGRTLMRSRSAGAPAGDAGGTIDIPFSTIPDGNSRMGANFAPPSPVGSVEGLNGATTPSMTRFRGVGAGVDPFDKLNVIPDKR